MGSKGIIPAILAALIGGASCGKDEREITLLTPIPIADPTRNFSALFDPARAGSSSLAAIGVGNLANACLQTEFRAGYAVGEGRPDTLIEVQLDSGILDQYNHLVNLPGAANSSQNSATAWLNSNSALRAPIRFKVPNTGEIRVGLRGVFYEPLYGLNSAGGACAKTGSLSIDDPQAFLVNALRPLPPDVDTVELRPFVLKTNLDSSSYTTPSPPPNIANPSPSETTISCFDLSNPRSCPNRDLLEFQFSLGFSPSTAFPGIGFEITYFPDFGVRSLSHHFKIGSNSSNIYVNHERVIPLHYKDSSGTDRDLLILPDLHQVKEGSIVQEMAPSGTPPQYQACLPWSNTALSSSFPGAGSCYQIILTIKDLGYGF